MLTQHVGDLPIELDCAEFPCIAIIEHAATDKIELGRLKAENFEGASFVELSTVGPGPDGVRYGHFFAPIPPGSAGDDIQERVRGRIDAHERESLREAYEAQGRPEIP